MILVTAGVLAEPTAAQLQAVAQVFDQYRQHYGEPAAPQQTLDWITDRHACGQLAIFAAYRGEELIGLATTVVIPASLRLSQYWQLRDLYVVPGARRCGAARVLIGAVQRAAAEAGALRLSVQTESGNAAALALYRSSGFTPVIGLKALMLPLHAASDGRP